MNKIILAAVLVAAAVCVYIVMRKTGDVKLMYAAVKSWGSSLWSK